MPPIERDGYYYAPTFGQPKLVLRRGRFIWEKQLGGTRRELSRKQKETLRRDRKVERQARKRGGK